MARPIKETPVLTGKDAKRFEKEIQGNASRKVSQEEYKRAEEAFKALTKARC